MLGLVCVHSIDPCPLTNNLNPANPRTCNPETCTSAPYTGTDWNLGCPFCDQIARQAFIVTKTTSDPAKHGFFDIYTTISRRQTDSCTRVPAHSARLDVTRTLLAQPSSVSSQRHALAHMHANEAFISCDCARVTVSRCVPL